MSCEVMANSSETYLIPADNVLHDGVEYLLV